MNVLFAMGPDGRIIKIVLSSTGIVIQAESMTYADTGDPVEGVDHLDLALSLNQPLQARVFVVSEVTGG